MLPEDLRRRIQAATEGVPCLKTLQLRPLEMDAGYVRMSARNDPRFNSRLPGVHGGILAYIADCVAWFAIVTQTGPETPLVTSDLSIRYLAPCLSDVLATGRVVKLGRTLCPVRVELFDEAEKLVAVADVCYMRLDSATALANQSRPTS